MSIRLNTVLGYGLADVDIYEDPRVNWTSPLLRLTQDEDEVKAMRERTSLEAYVGYLESLRDGDDELSEKNREVTLDLTFLQWDMDGTEKVSEPSNCVVWDTEDPDTRVLLIRPIYLNKWHRVDDDIDVVTHERMHGFAPSSHVHVLNYGLHPYGGLYMDKRNGRRLPNTIMTWIQASYHAVDPERRKQEREVSEVVLSALARTAGFESHREARENVVPLVPASVRHVVEFGGLFTNPRVVWELRPMLYTFWI
jgi:hypothetical protein